MRLLGRRLLGHRLGGDGRVGDQLGWDGGTDERLRLLAGERRLGDDLVGDGLFGLGLLGDVLGQDGFLDGLFGDDVVHGGLDDGLFGDDLAGRTASTTASSATSSATSASATASSAIAVAASASATAASATISAAAASSSLGEQRVGDGVLGSLLRHDGLEHGLVGDDLGGLGFCDGLFGHDLGCGGLDHGLFGDDLGRDGLDDGVVGDGDGFVGTLGRLVGERLRELVLKRGARLVDARPQVVARRGLDRLVAPRRERPRGGFGDGFLDHDRLVDDRLGRRPGLLHHGGASATAVAVPPHSATGSGCGYWSGAAPRSLPLAPPASWWRSSRPLFGATSRATPAPIASPSRNLITFMPASLTAAVPAAQARASRRSVRRKKRARALQFTALYTLGRGAVLPGGSGEPLRRDRPVVAGVSRTTHLGPHCSLTRTAASVSAALTSLPTNAMSGSIGRCSICTRTPSSLCLSRMGSALSSRRRATLAGVSSSAALAPATAVGDVSRSLLTLRAKNQIDDERDAARPTRNTRTHT